MSNICNFERNFTFFAFLFCASQPEVKTPGPRHDRVVCDSVLHGTVLITNFSVLLPLPMALTS